MQGSTTNLSKESQQAFRALVNSIVPSETVSVDGNPSREAAEKLSEKLKELVGEEAMEGFEQHRNDRGELVNEEGLPIIEISEPVQNPESRGSENAPVIDDTPPVNMRSLPSVAMERLRLRRNQILDTLEEEERQDDERQKRSDREEREEILRRRREEAVNERAQMGRAKELQKKMGKALLRNMGQSETRDDPSMREGKGALATDSQANPTPTTSKKTVTFVGQTDSVSNIDEPDWGDVTAARLRSGLKPTLLQSLRSENNPVKLNVVERKPAGNTTTTPKPNRTPTQPTRDSDDESEPEDNEAYQDLESDESNGALAEEPPDSEVDDTEVELENECDLDYAQHQREVVLEYYKKRNTIGQDAARAMINHTHEEEEEETNFELPTPKDSTRPSISRFRADRIASAYGALASDRADSAPLADYVLPESSGRTIQRAIRTGRVDDSGQLIGGEDDSDSENEMGALQEVLELLKKGEVYNLGPDGKHLHTIPPEAKEPTATKASSSVAPPPSTPAQLLLPPLDRPQISKFKVDRTKAGRSPSPRSTASTPPTPISHFERSSPKLPTILSEKTSAQTLEALPADFASQSSSSVTTESSSFRAPKPTYPQMKAPAESFTSMVIESPSFPNQISTTASSSGALPMITIDSPTFSPPGRQASSRRPDRPPLVIASNSQPGGSSIPLQERPTATTSSSGTVRPQGESIMASTVRERIPPPPRGTSQDADQAQGSGAIPKKISRFKQGRNE